MQYVLLLSHIVSKFTLHLWQVPRSSVGRALYRESGPSQDGDPVPGNLPFFVGFFFLYIFLLKGSFLFRVCTKIKDNMKNPCIPVILPDYIRKGFLPLTDKLTLFLYSEIRDCHRNAAKSERC